MITPTVHKLYSPKHRDSVYFRDCGTRVEHWGPRIDGIAHDRRLAARRLWTQYRAMGYQIAERIF